MMIITWVDRIGQNLLLYLHVPIQLCYSEGVAEPFWSITLLFAMNKNAAAELTIDPSSTVCFCEDMAFETPQ